MTKSIHRTRLALLSVSLVVAALLLPRGADASATSASGWRTDPAWYAGKAEWALYDAVRPIYGKPRQYEATIFTNKQHMDPGSTAKQSGREGGGIEVFKHNLSEMIPTENYTYRFLTTAFIRTDTLQPYKVVFSSQEDCGATYKQFVVDGKEVDARQFCYFPDGGATPTTYARPDDIAFHDGLSLTLRDYPFDADTKPTLTLTLVPDQTDTHETGQRGQAAEVTYVERTTIEIPYGPVDAHHLRVTHPGDGGVTQSDYWFAADADMHHVMVKYAGPYGVEYELKRLEWWAYWGEPRP